MGEEAFNYCGELAALDNSNTRLCSDLFTPGKKKVEEEEENVRSWAD